MLDKELIKKEFNQLAQKLKQSQSSFKEALLPENKKKNRYNNVLPLENTRVQLYCNNCFSRTKCTQRCTCSEDNYINSNYVSTPLSQNLGRYFIATQCPMPTTYENFWRMIWQNNVRMVFMLSDFIEDGVVKGNQYFPTLLNQEIQYGTFKVKLVSVIEQNVLVREFTIKNITQNEAPRKVYHVHYTRWPDHGIPSQVEEVLAMVQIAENFFNHFGSPIVVHCSAGIGRTGTFISIYNCITSLRVFGQCNILNTVAQMREERHGSVTREMQYEFIYSVVVYYMNACNNAKITTN